LGVELGLGLGLELELLLLGEWCVFLAMSGYPSNCGAFSVHLRSEWMAA
jgi:hypothetical protein